MDGVGLLTLALALRGCDDGDDCCCLTKLSISSVDRQKKMRVSEKSTKHFQFEDDAQKAERVEAFRTIWILTQSNIGLLLQDS